MSYPWVVKVSIKYKGREDGLPNKQDVTTMDEIEDLILESGILHSGPERQVLENALYSLQQKIIEAHLEMYSKQSAYLQIALILTILFIEINIGWV